MSTRHDDTLELLVADFLAARQDTVDLPHQLTQEQLAAPVPMVTGEQATGDLFAGRAGHATEHITSIESVFGETWRVTSTSSGGNENGRSRPQ